MRVLELSDREEAAAFCAKLFGRWGAEVIKVEPPGRAAPLPAIDIYLNGGKQRTRLDLGAATDRQRIEVLGREADVIITDYAPAAVDEAGLLALGGPSTVRVSVTPFGLSGPYRDRPATAATLLALGGYTWLMGDAGREPLTMPGNYPYYQAGTFAYIAALSSYLARSPAAIEVSVLECLTSLHQFTDTMWRGQGMVRSRHGNRWENLCPTTFLRCKDGWYGLNILQNFWFPFAQMIGHPEMTGEHEFATNQGRMADQDRIEAIIQDALWDMPRKTIFKEGQETWRVPLSYVASLGDLLEDPHLNERGFWRPVEVSAGPVAGAIRVPASPFRLMGEAFPFEEAPLAAAGASWGPLAPPPAGPAGVSAPAEPAAARPLAGVRVIDLTRIWSGPLSTRILADLGAEVIKVEAHTGRGGASPERWTAPAAGRPWNTQGLFNKLNRNKTSVALDLKHPKGRQVFLDLVAKSDVVIENFSARAMPGLGLGYEDLKAVNERIIYVAMQAYGMFGPYRDYVGLGPSIEPLMGLSALMGYSADEPRSTSKALTDAIAGSAAAAAVVTALAQRSRTGKGYQVDLSQHEAGVTYIGEAFVEAQIEGHEPERLGNRHPVMAPQGVYRCAGEDSWIAISAQDDAAWQVLCDALGLGALATAAKLSTAEGRRQSHADIDRQIEAATSLWDKRELEASLQARGVAAGAVLSAPEWLEEPHLLARGYFVDLTHEEAGPGTWDGSPVRFDGTGGYETWTAAPCLGAENRSTLRALLSLIDAEIDALYAEGVLAESPV